jgi:hypothetical protein
MLLFPGRDVSRLLTGNEMDKRGVSVFGRTIQTYLFLVFWGEGLNSGPHAYEANTEPLSYIPSSNTDLF